MHWMRCLAGRVVATQALAVLPPCRTRRWRDWLICDLKNAVARRFLGQSAFAYSREVKDILRMTLGICEIDIENTQYQLLLLLLPEEERAEAGWKRIEGFKN